MITMGAVRALREFDLQHRIALIGFDDYTLAYRLDSGVAVVAQDPRTIGPRAAELLFSMMEDPDTAHQPRGCHRAYHLDHASIRGDSPGVT